MTESSRSKGCFECKSVCLTYGRRELLRPLDTPDELLDELLPREIDGLREELLLPREMEGLRKELLPREIDGLRELDELRFEPIDEREGADRDTLGVREGDDERGAEICGRVGAGARNELERDGLVTLDRDEGLGERLIVVRLGAEVTGGRVTVLLDRESDEGDRPVVVVRDGELRDGNSNRCTVLRLDDGEESTVGRDERVVVRGVVLNELRVLELRVLEESILESTDEPERDRVTALDGRDVRSV